jgi:tetratricopeptide (TPR) repeat protein
MPDDPRAQVMDGSAATREALAVGNLQLAIGHVGRALSVDPGQREWRALLDEIIGRADDPLALAPLAEGGETDLVTAALRAYILAARGDHGAALLLLTQVARARPDVPFLLWGTEWVTALTVAELPLDVAGGIVVHLMRLVTAVPAPAPPDDPRRTTIEHANRILDRFRQLYPQQALFWYVGSMIARRLGQAEAGVALAATAYRLEANFSTCTGLANALRDASRIDEAAARYREALGFEPTDVAAWTDLGDMMLAAGRLREALEAYGRVLAREPTNAWALASTHFARWRQDGDPIAREALLRARAVGGERARVLADAIDRPVPYVNVLPPPRDPSAAGLLEVLEAVQERPRNEGGTVTVSSPQIESPSLLLAWDLALARLDESRLQLELTVEQVQDPDPRRPRGPVDFVLWRFDGVVPEAAVAPPAATVADEVAALAREPFHLELWEPVAQAVGARLGVAAVPDLLAAMVHPPPPEADWPVADWLQRVQLAAALLVAHVEPGWAGSTRRRALVALALGPVDWTVTAAIVALTRLAARDAAIRADVLPLFAALEAVVSATAYTCYAAPLAHCWLQLEPDAATRDRLLAWLARLRDEEAARGD